MAQPRSGIKPINCHQPLLSMSCNRREVTAKCGKSVPKDTSAPGISPMRLPAMITKKTNNTHHQNSDLEARPLNSAYFLKHDWIDWPKVIGFVVNSGSGPA